MQKRNGFTLVEMLVVIVIIGLLAGITTVAFRGARQSVKSNLISVETTQLAMALDAYKNKFSEYPPDFSDAAAVERHLKKRWPRYTGTVNEFFLKIREAWEIPADADMSFVSSLIVWLGGLPDADGKPNGFFLNPTNPFDSTTGQREETFFDFDAKYITRIKDVPAFVLNEFPVVYFRSVYGKGYEDKFYRYENDETVGDAVPYLKAEGKWYEDGRFQLVHPGLDGTFGAADESKRKRIVPTQQGTTSGDADNVTNFVTSGTLESLYE